ncbi:hypothetical protein OGAPHI_006898 [Ogataea philodendri]|uniref:Uncharacterized protein n=1 Tax=Ogataea philodendri TaxID=1378263 RepID=A0A9P8NW62_9ASCO|nr:uncharacterized protein OGAPHI_006898 [Ogataea philodendri]KAH3660312.1 hypothetical protein OGAPHI_006898 [Ogataea philodendri]
MLPWLYPIQTPFSNTCSSSKDGSIMTFEPTSPTTNTSTGWNSDDSGIRSVASSQSSANEGSSSISRSFVVDVSNGNLQDFNAK